MNANKIGDDTLVPRIMAELRATIAELEVAEEELRRQNEMLAQSRAVIEAERQRYQSLFDLATDALLVTDESGVIREANQAAARRIGIAQRFAVGKPLPNFIESEADRRRVRVDLLHLRAGACPREWEVRVRPRKGPPFDALLSAAATATTATTAGQVRWTLRDISDGKRAERDLRTRLAMLEQLLAGNDQPTGPK